MDIMFADGFKTDGGKNVIGSGRARNILFDTVTDANFYRIEEIAKKKNITLLAAAQELKFLSEKKFLNLLNIKQL